MHACWAVIPRHHDLVSHTHYPSPCLNCHVLEDSCHVIDACYCNSQVYLSALCNLSIACIDGGLYRVYFMRAQPREYSRVSQLSEVRPPRYTGHLFWHGLLARGLLHKTRPKMRPLCYFVYTGHYTGCL